MAAQIFPTCPVERCYSRVEGYRGRPLRTLSPKFNRPTARPPRTTVKCSHERNVRSLAKETLGSTRTGRAIRFEAVLCNSGWVDIVVQVKRYRSKGKFRWSPVRLKTESVHLSLKLKAYLRQERRPTKKRTFVMRVSNLRGYIVIIHTRII